jgi:hypothetical protein
MERFSLMEALQNLYLDPFPTKKYRAPRESFKKRFVGHRGTERVADVLHRRHFGQTGGHAGRSGRQFQKSLHLDHRRPKIPIRHATPPREPTPSW